MSYHQPTTVNGLHKAMYADLRRWFSFIIANGAYLGSLSGYIHTEVEQAAEDGAPNDVTTSRDWASLSERQQSGTVEEERDGHAYIVRDDQGQPVRVWYRIGGYDNPLVVGHLTAMASRTRKHGSPWTTGEADDLRA